MCLSDGSRDSKLQEAQTPASVGLQESAGAEGHGAGASATQPRDRPSDSARCSASFQRTPATSSGRRLTTSWPSPSSTFLGLAVPTLPPRSLRTTPSPCSPSQRPRAAHVCLSHGGLSNHVSECVRPHVCCVCPSCKGRIVLISSAELRLRGMGSTWCRGGRSACVEGSPWDAAPTAGGHGGSGLCVTNGRALRGRSIMCSFTMTRTAPPHCSCVHMTHSGHHGSSCRVSGWRALEGTDPGSPAGSSSCVWSPEPTEFYMRSHHAFHRLCSVPAPFRPLCSSSSTR